MAADKRVTIIIAAKERALGVLNRIGGGLAGIALKAGRAGFALANLAGVAGALFARSVVSAASTTESLRIRLDALLGSVEEGGKALKQMADFAATVPFELEEIIEASTLLAAVVEGGADEISALLPVVGDLAAVTGLSFREVGAQIQRTFSAGIGAAELFRDRGVTAMLGFKSGVQVSAEESKKVLIEAFNDPESKFRGASQRMADTWIGLLSMMSDRWFVFRNLVAEAGFFDALKAGLKEILERLQMLSDSGALERLAELIGSKLGTAISFVLGKTNDLIDATVRNGEVWLAWGKVTLASIKFILVTLTSLVRIVTNIAEALGKAIAFGALRFVTGISLLINEALINPTNRFIANLNKIPGVNIDFRIGGLPVAELNRQTKQAGAEFLDQFKDIGDAISDVGDAGQGIIDSTIEVLIAKQKRAMLAQTGLVAQAKEASETKVTISTTDTDGGGLSTAGQKALETLIKNLQTARIQSDLLGPSFSLLSAEVSAYETFLKAAAAAGLAGNTVLNATMGTVDTVVATWRRLSNAQIANAKATELQNAQMALAKRLVAENVPQVQQLAIQQDALRVALAASAISAEEFAREMARIDEEISGVTDATEFTLATVGKQFERTFKDLGTDLILSFGKGMNGAKDVLNQIFSSILRGLIGKALSLFSIFSPSKVSAGWGMNIILGMVVGLQSTQRVLTRAWEATLATFQPPGAVGGLLLSGAGAAQLPIGNLGALAQAGDLKRLEFRLEGPPLPPSTNPLASARDREVQAWFNEIRLVGKELGTVPEDQ